MSENDGSLSGGTLDFDCAPDDAVFFKVVQPVLQRSMGQISAVVDSFVQAIKHLEGVEDDRAIILVCALLLENSVDTCLKAVGPKYHQIEKDRDVTFSMKTRVLKVLCLVPPKLIDGIWPIRKIRNEFAHTLSIRSFDQVNAKLFQALDTQRQGIFTNFRANASRRDAVIEMTKAILMGLQVFRLHLDMLRRLLKTAEFHNLFEKFCKVTSD